MRISEIVTEWVNNPNYLYHGSDAENALKILQSKKLKDFTASRVPHMAGKTGVSLTRNARYAQSGSDDAGRRSASVGGNTIGTDVVFVFDK